MRCDGDLNTHYGYLLVFDGSKDRSHEVQLDVIWFRIGEGECVRGEERRQDLLQLLVCGLDLHCVLPATSMVSGRDCRIRSQGLVGIC
jgi:hypothetical protein